MATKNNSSVGVIIVLIIIIIGAIIAGIVLSNNNNSGLTSSDKSADKTAITTNWDKFFASSTSLSERENLLQNGKQFATLIQGEFSSLGAGTKTAAKVNNITINTASKGTVTYTVYLNSAPVLTNQTGTALKENGNWVVSDSTLCGLIKIVETTPKICKNY